MDCHRPGKALADQRLTKWTPPAGSPDCRAYLGATRAARDQLALLEARTHRQWVYRRRCWLCGDGWERGFGRTLRIPPRPVTRNQETRHNRSSRVLCIFHITQALPCNGFLFNTM